MLEVCLFFLVIVGIILLELGAEVSKDQSQITIAEDLKLPDNKFLAQLQQEVESNILPRPSDATLMRHYHSLLKAELEARLSSMPSS